MSKRRTILVAVFGVLALGASARADLMPICPLDAGCRSASIGRVVTEPPRAVSFDLPGGTVADLDLLLTGSLSTVKDNVEQAGQMQPVHILTDGQNSFSLCLYALLGLGLCKSAPFVRKFSFCLVPQWYHEGGPAQVGHSVAISPDCVCSAPVCFVQPQSMAENPIPRYHFPTVVSRWRNSQFTPAVLASRAPPFCSC